MDFVLIIRDLGQWKPTEIALYQFDLNTDHPVCKLGSVAQNSHKEGKWVADEGTRHSSLRR